MTSKEYIVNECNVCVNPDVLKICDEAYIKLAHIGGLYYYGYGLDLGDRGVIYPCMVKAENACATEGEAIVGASGLMILDLDYTLTDDQYCEQCKRVRSKIFKFNNCRAQLSLF